MYKNYFLSAIAFIYLFSPIASSLHAKFMQKESFPYISATNYRQYKAAEDMTRLGTRYYNKALQAKTDTEKLEYTLQFMRNHTSGYINGNQSALRYLINGSAELCKTPHIRKEIRRERKRAKNNTLATKNFKNIQILALNTGLLAQASEQLLSKDFAVNKKGQENFLRGINNLINLKDSSLKNQKISVVEDAIKNLNNQALTQNIAFNHIFADEVYCLGNMLLEAN